MTAHIQDLLNKPFLYGLVTLRPSVEYEQHLLSRVSAVVRLCPQYCTVQTKVQPHFYNGTPATHWQISLRCYAPIANSSGIFLFVLHTIWSITGVSGRWCTRYNQQTYFRAFFFLQCCLAAAFRLIIQHSLASLLGVENTTCTFNRWAVPSNCAIAYVYMGPQLSHNLKRTAQRSNVQVVQAAP